MEGGGWSGGGGGNEELCNRGDHCLVMHARAEMEDGKREMRWGE